MVTKKNILFIISLCICLFANAQYTKLFDFTGTTTGSAPYGSLVSDGTSLYGITHLGGTNNTGAIFKINLDGTGYIKLKDLDSTIGNLSESSLILDSTHLYGTTRNGGLNGTGVIFKINIDGSGYTKLHDFDCIDGCVSVSSLILQGQYLYGTTYMGGSVNKGTIFKIMTDGTGYSKIHEFSNYLTGFNPYSSLIADSTFLYGMTTDGGVHSDGIIFKLKHDGSGFTKLMDFGGVNGSEPYSSLIYDGTFLYGTTSSGGVNNKGIIFKIKPDGSGYAKILDFNDTDGNYPKGSLIYDGTFLYGIVPGGQSDGGLIFQIKPDGTGYANVCDLVGVIAQVIIHGTPILNGTSLYGMTVAGGTSDLGTIFKCGNTVGIFESLKTNIKIFPNPTTSILNIVDEQQELQNSTIEIKNYLGQVVFASAFTNQIDMSALSNGMYFLIIQSGANSKVVKIVKQ